MSKKLPVYVLTMNHFDPTWRRCWRRRFSFKGWTYVSYAELEDYYMSDNLALARKHPEYKFEAESVVVVREYLRRHPERQAELRKLAKAGRFAVPGAGDNIVDANMPLGESLVRNFVTGLLWVEDNLGLRTRVGIRNDGFGNSAQIPQIFRGCEIEAVSGFSYSNLPAKFWRGLDGSTIAHSAIARVGSGGGCDKYAPCPECRGKGCKACGGRAIHVTLCSRLPASLDEKALEEAGGAIVMLGPEELLPNPEIVRWVRQWRKKHDVRFALHEETLAHCDWLPRVDDPPKSDVFPGVELNPNNSGVLVTRIRLKQMCREQEYDLLGAETLWTWAAMAGAKVPREEFHKAWETLLFTMFHDAITSTHVDAAYEELLDMGNDVYLRTRNLRERALARLTARAANCVSVVNPLGSRVSGVVSKIVATRGAGVAVLDEAGRPQDVVSCERLAAAKGCLSVRFLAREVGAMSSRTYRIVPGKAPKAPKRLSKPVIENECFRVVADDHGIRCIVDKRLKRTILMAGEYRPNELILERDEGSPWATLSPDRARFPLAAGTALKGAEAAPAYQRLVFECVSPLELKKSGRVTMCSARQVVTLYRGIPRVEFRTEVRWNTFNMRLRVAMPVASTGRAIYGIPYGALERVEYAPTYGWTGANGDWPAVDWAGIQAKGVSVALLNKGLPSYCVERARERQTMFLSVLRSPVVPTYLHEPESYTMTDYDGMRDPGDHTFEYAITAYDKPFADSDVVAEAEGYNAGLIVVNGRVSLPGAPMVDCDNVRMSALKPSEKGDALIVRLCEYRGRPTDAAVTVPPGVREVRKVNLLERNGQSLKVRDGSVRVALRPWEIATLRMEGALS